MATPAYGGDDQGRRKELVPKRRCLRMRRSVLLRLDALEAGHVYELRVRSLLEEGKELFPAEAFYTMKSVP